MNRPLRVLRPSLWPQFLNQVLPAFALFALASSPLLGWAQVGAPTVTVPQPAPAASASVAPIMPGGKPGPRLLSPTEKRDSEAQPDDLKTDRPVTPQISIPFGKKAPPQNARPTR